MNYITACPNCETQFILNDELIKAHRGKVQCGHCEHVFNAKNRLTVVDDDSSSADGYRADTEDAVAKENEQVFISENSIVSDTMHDVISETEFDESEQDNAETDEFIKGGSEEEEPKPVEIEAVEATSVELIKTESVNKQTDVDYFISPPASEVEPTMQTTTEAELPEQTVNIDAIFTNKNRGNKKPSKYSFLIGLINFILFMVILLICAYFLRTEIANRFPPIKPLLERACVPLKCTVDLSKNLNLITIGDSDMQEDDTYQSVIKFSSSLQNNANYPQAYPSLELTLTDNNDRAVIKKLITPKLYLVSKEKVKRGLDANETATIKLSFHVADPSVASYRVLLLY